jgi:hypothetical protein
MIMMKIALTERGIGSSHSEWSGRASSKGKTDEQAARWHKRTLSVKGLHNLQCNNPPVGSIESTYLGLETG